MSYGSKSNTMQYLKLQLLLTNEEKQEIVNNAKQEGLSQTKYLVKFFYDNGLFGKKNKVQNSWEKAYKILQDYYKEFGSLPKQIIEYGGIKLGRWYYNQKSQYQNDKLSDQRIKLLDKIDPTWNAVKLSRSNTLGWDGSYKILQDYYKEFGSLPKQNIEYGGIKLGRWLSTRKVELKNGKLSKDRIKLLDKIDPTWK